MPKLVFIRCTGVGKSSTINSLCGIQNEFSVGSNIESVTTETTVK